MDVDTITLGVTPLKTVRGALLMRGKTIQDIANELDVHYNSVTDVINGDRRSDKISTHLEEALELPIVTEKLTLS